MVFERDVACLAETLGEAGVERIRQLSPTLNVSQLARFLLDRTGQLTQHRAEYACVDIPEQRHKSTLSRARRHGGGNRICLELTSLVTVVSW